MTNDYGIDYGMGTTNVDPKTGIRYGVISQNDVLQSWADSSEPDYSDPTCPKCGNPAIDLNGDDVPDDVPDLDDSPDGWEDNGRDYACPHCRYAFDSDEVYGDEAIGFDLDDGEYVAHQGGDDCDIFILKSPYFTYAQYCSPCAPGACYLRSPVDSNGPKAYCFAPDWFDYWDDETGHGPQPTGEYCGEKTSCPYPVYRVSDGECVFTPKATEG